MCLPVFHREERSRAQWHRRDRTVSRLYLHTFNVQYMLVGTYRMAVFTFRHIAALLMLLNFLLFYWGILPWFLFAGFMYIWVLFGAV